MASEHPIILLQHNLITLSRICIHVFDPNLVMELRVCGRLGPGEIDEVDLAHGLVGDPLAEARVHELDGEDGVAPAGGVVHVGAGGGADVVAGLHQREYVVVVHDEVLREVLHVGSGDGMLAHLQVVLGVLSQEVLHPLVVYLQVADLSPEEERQIGLSNSGTLSCTNAKL